MTGVLVMAGYGASVLLTIRLRRVLEAISPRKLAGKPLEGTES